jgi:acetyl esterase/lipase
MALSGVKKQMAREGRAFSDMLAKIEKRQTVKAPYSKLHKAYHFSEHPTGAFSCFKISVKNSRPKGAIMYLYGGGFFMPPGKGDFMFAAEIAQKTETEVWFPLYPLVPHFKLMDSVKMVLEVYKAMLEQYSHKKINFIGFSSGGALALSVCIQNKHEGGTYQMPNKLILVSAGTELPPNEEQLKEMERLSAHDPMLVPVFFQHISPFLTVPGEEYLLSSALYDLRGFPAMDFYYGTHEIMYAYLPAIKKAAEKAHVPYTVHIGEGMCHCWPMLGFTKEGRQAREEIYSSIISSF